MKDMPVAQLREKVEHTLQEPGGVCHFTIMLSSGRVVSIVAGPVVNNSVAAKMVCQQKLSTADDAELWKLMEQLLGPAGMQISSKAGVTEEQANRELMRFFGGGQG